MGLHRLAARQGPQLTLGHRIQMEYRMEAGAVAVAVAVAQRPVPTALQDSLYLGHQLHKEYLSIVSPSWEYPFM